MSNKEFYDNLRALAEAGKIHALWKKSSEMPKEYVRIMVGKSALIIDISIMDFASIIMEKIANHAFFTQSLLRKHIGKSDTYIFSLIKKGIYECFRLKSNTKFYIRKDW